MEPIENYRIYKREMVFEMPTQYPTWIKLVLLFFGSLDTVFGSILFIVLLISPPNKEIIGEALVIIIISWVGGLSCLMTSKQQKRKDLSFLMILGSIIGIAMGIFWIYAIAVTLLR